MAKRINAHDLAPGLFQIIETVIAAKRSVRRHDLVHQYSGHSKFIKGLREIAGLFSWTRQGIEEAGSISGSTCGDVPMRILAKDVLLSATVQPRGKRVSLVYLQPAVNRVTFRYLT